MAVCGHRRFFAAAGEHHDPSVHSNGFRSINAFDVGMDADYGVVYDPGDGHRSAEVNTCQLEEMKVRRPHRSSCENRRERLNDGFTFAARGGERYRTLACSFVRDTERFFDGMHLAAS